MDLVIGATHVAFMRPHGLPTSASITTCVPPNRRVTTTTQRARTRRVSHSGGVRQPLPTKTCAACGREITWRKKWASSWDQVRYCSQACRRHGLTPTDAALEAELRRLLRTRARSSSICPSEVARAVDPDDWRPLLEPARAAARRLVAAGGFELVQGGHVVGPSTARGDIRVRRAR